ncbi:MAG: hypothetical protein ACPGOV_12090 [Magnetovibrionaceae bacterium]
MPRYTPSYRQDRIAGVSVHTGRVDTQSKGASSRSGTVVTLGRNAKMALSRPFKSKSNAVRRGITCTVG